MRIPIRLAVFLTVSLSLFFSVSSASADTVPTHGRSSYGSDPSNILTMSPPPFSSDGLSLNGENFCSFSNSSGDECALSEAYQITSATLPVGTTSVTITIPTAPGSMVEILPPASVGVLTNDSSGGNIYFTSGLTEAQVLALPNGSFSTGVDGSGNAFITINDLSLLNGLAFYVDLLDVSGSGNGPFGNGDFCSDKTCTFINDSGDTETADFDVPSLATPEVSVTTSSAAPEPGTLMSLVSGLGLIGLIRRRANR